MADKVRKISPAAMDAAASVPGIYSSETIMLAVMFEQLFVLERIAASLKRLESAQGEKT